MRAALLLLAFLGQNTSSRHIVFVVDKITQTAEAHNAPFGGAVASSGEHHSAPIVMAEFSKKCPVVSFTQDQTAADFILQTQSGGTTLADPKGNVLYVSPAKNLGNMVKDVCKFISSR
jgi:hypothetical protein